MDMNQQRIMEIRNLLSEIKAFNEQLKLLFYHYNDSIEDSTRLLQGEMTALKLKAALAMIKKQKLSLIFSHG